MQERKPFKSLKIDLNLLPLFVLTPGPHGNGLTVPGKTGIILLGLEGNQETQINLYGKSLLYSTKGMDEHGYQFQKLLRRFERGELHFEPQIRTAFEGGLPLILYMENHGTIIQEPWAANLLSILTFGENPLNPGKSYQVDYLGPRALTTYEEAMQMGLPFLKEIRQKTGKLNQQVLDKYNRFRGLEINAA
jgi:hypothetical protein